MMVLGSPRFAHHLMQLGLVDEYKITISPVILGSGLPLFKGIAARTDLKLIQSKTFNSGTLSLVYQTIKQNG
jgi:dihydrofolate reductase